MASISKTATVNLLSNQDEKLSEIQQKIREQAKLELFQTLDLDERKFTDINTTISDLKEAEKDNTKIVTANNISYKYATLKEKIPFKEIFEKYSTAKDDEKEKMYMELSERIILSNFGVISYKDGDLIGENTVDENFVKQEYETLNKVDAYKGNLDFFTVKDKKNGKLYIIRWKKTEIDEIKEKENNLIKEKLDKIYNKNKDNEEEIRRLTEQLNEPNTLIETEKTPTKTTKKIEKGYLTEEQIDKILEDKLKKYLAPLLETQEKKILEIKELNSESRESNRESIEKNPLYVSRKDVEKSVLASRKDSVFPIGNVEIKGTYVRLEEFDFYEEIKQEYIFAKGDSVKLAELDKKLAELIILSSPRGVDTEKRYQIQLTEEEIIAGGLVVSKDLLAKYGLEVYSFEYTNTIIQREYIERLESIQKIETEIAELTTSITELRKTNIEGHYDEQTCLKIKQKEERQKELRRTLRTLILSLASLGNKGIDKDLLVLKDTEKQLQKELDDLKKKKKNQDDVNARIKEIEEELKNNETNNNEEKIKSKQKKLDELLGYIAELENKKREKESRLNSDKVTGIEKITLKEDIEKLDKEIQNYKKDAEKLQSKIDNLQNGLNGKISEKIRKEIEHALDSIPEGRKESIYLVKNGTRCSLEKQGDFYHIMQGPTHLLGDTELSSLKKEELLAALDPDNVDKILIGEKEISLSEDKALRDELGRLLKEQEGFDKVIDKHIADKETELANIREQITNKEKGKRTVVERFEHDEQYRFYDFCKKNGIKREDGQEISENHGMDPDKIYIDKDGKKLKLEPNEGLNDDGYDQPIANLELVYYEGGESEDTVTQQLLQIMDERERLETEKKELEIKLQKERSESIKITIEEQIKEVNQKLLNIKEKVTEITNYTKKYKETITQDKYYVYGARPIPVPDWKEPFEMTAVLSDMGTDVFREKASLKVEEDLKTYYKSLGRWQVGSRLALFLGRGHKRKKMINKEMNSMANTAFQRGAGYTTLNDQSQNAADRHEHELNTAMEAINKITTVHNVQVDQLCRDYLNNRITDDQFQDQFNQIIASDANIQNVLNGQNITHIGTNVLLKLQEQKALKNLVDNLDSELNKYNLATTVSQKQIILNNMQNLVEKYIKDYQKLPAFMPNFESFVKNRVDVQHNLENYLKHQSGVMKMQIRNLTMNLDILNKGKSAYQIDNKDRETGKGSWKYRLGHLMDKHPRGTAIASTAISVGIGLGTGLIASPVLAGAVSLGLFGGLVGTTNAVKKWTHHTKEQNTHEKNVATDYRNEQAKIQAWQNQALNGRGWRKYKAKRQLALYDQTTQENIRLSDQITEYITNLSSKVGPLTADEDNFMRCNLIEGWARLKYYRQMGHNFLASEQVDSTEKDMKRLEKSITLGLEKLSTTMGHTITTNDIEQNMTATNDQNTNITYDVIQKDLKASYDKSLIQFKRERRNLSLKYGFGTAIASIGVGAFFQWITGTGIAAKEIPGTPGTPGAPETTTSHAGGTDNFGLGKSNLALDPSLGVTTDTYNQTVSAITGAPNGSTVNFIYGVGTDATPVIPGHLTASDLTSKLSEVSSNIGAMSGLTTAQKNAFLTELSSLSHSGFTNNNLASMRAAEYLEHCAQAMSDVGNTSLIPTFSRTLGASGGTYNNLAERFMTGAIDITTPAIPGTPGTPPIPGKRRGRWFMGMPLFFNTFKDRKDTTDTTDQNWGRGSSQQPNQPQVNPNQPQVNPNQPQANPNQPKHP